jgi:iron complex transport system substrate-binding protein
MKIIFFHIILIFSIINISCNRSKISSDISKIFNNLPDSALISSVKYATGFDIFEIDNIKKLVIYNPQNNAEILSTYYLIDSALYNNFIITQNILKTPLDSTAVFSATQLNAFSKLGIINRVIAISESEYIKNPEIRKRYTNNQIVELANNGNFYLEKTLELNPKIIFYSPYNLAQKHPLAATNITMIPFFDFMESNPLGRAEWIKFTALFFDKESEADSIFNTIVSEYNDYKQLALKADNKPTVFSDKYYSGQWFMSGGKSYIAQLFEDAGANYLWKNNQSSGSINLDFEVVFNKAHNADFWRIVGTYPDGFSYEKLGNENNLYKNFKSFKDKKVIFCDSKTTNYFETGTLEPQLLLADLIHAFHPELLEDYKPKYYNLIND